MLLAKLRNSQNFYAPPLCTFPTFSLKKSFFHLGGALAGSWRGVGGKPKMYFSKKMTVEADILIQKC
jgi:hypothetical protein